MATKRMPSIESLTAAIEPPPVAQAMPLVTPPVEVIGALEVESMLKDLMGPDGLIEVDVLVSHDDLYAGSRVRLPPSDRLVGLIIAGWLDVPLKWE